MRKIDSAELRLVEAGGFVNNDTEFSYDGYLLDFTYDKEDHDFEFMFDFESFAYSFNKYGYTLIGFIKELLH